MTVTVTTTAAPKVKAKKGATKPCGHPGCPYVLRFTVDRGWVHGIRNFDYDHDPVF